MTRYQALRAMGCGPFTAGFVSFINFLFDVPQGYIGFMHIVIEYDAKDNLKGD